MINKNRVALIVGVLLVAVFFIFKSNSKSPYKETNDSDKLESKILIPANQKEINSQAHLSAVVSLRPEKNKKILLNSENFESLSRECFQGAKCEVEGDIWEQYLNIKNEGKNSTTDLYIAFLRKKLRDSQFRDQYKDILKKMIKDFYSADKIDFQMAAYYNYLGDLNSSLEAYLALEKKSQTNPKIFTAPKLNIANTYYDLKKFKEALLYYKASLNDLKSTETNDSLESIAFINERIDLIQEKLRR